MSAFCTHSMDKIHPSPSCRRRKDLARVSLLIAVLALAGCQTDYEDMTAAQRAAYRRASSIYTYKPDPNAPIQVTYRIDDHRFVTLENYDRCFGDNYYNDTRIGVHQKVWTGEPIDYRGRLVVDDRSGTNVVLPTARNSVCGDRGCTVKLAYSTDSGRTFNWLPYIRNSSRPSEDSENYTIMVNRETAFVVKDKGGSDYYIVKYPLIAGYVYGSGERLPGTVEIEFNAPMPSKLTTPSGQDRFTCDASIRSAGQPKTP
jgi:hypothetical protein